MLYVGAQAGHWAYANFLHWKNKNAGSFIFNPAQKIKDLFRAPQKTAPAAAPAQTVRVVSEESAVIDVVKKASPAVVSVIASEEVPKLEQCFEDYNSGLPPQLRDFFNFDFRVPGLCQRGTEIQRVGAASGFIASADGYILTNKHVVENDRAEYTVVLNDEKNFGKKVKALVVARDPANDIAVLKINLSGLPELDFGDSDKLQVGQTAIAIGYSLGQFENTVSKGVVSGLLRSITAAGSRAGAERLRGLIQTDAAINPGNSGGPLLDIGGNVIGMNVAVADAQSIGFAIPINAVKKVYDEVRTTGKISAAKQPFLGVRYVPVNEELKKNYKLSYDYGMLLVKGKDVSEPAVAPGSPADQAGLKEGDIILEAGGKKLDERNLLGDVIAERKIGDDISLLVFSGGQTRDIKVKLGEK
ncbi:trypsin-like serine protease [Patescibacteria group bacterium]|nr:MAG: trypsin-like serine protease [Patescibacteria group bacterium]